MEDVFEKVPVAIIDESGYRQSETRRSLIYGKPGFARTRASGE